MSENSQPGKENSSSALRAYSNPGLSPEALRAKRLEEQRNEVFELLINSSKDAVGTITDIMHYSEDDGHRLKAAQDILNRGGMKQAQEIAVTHTNTVSPAEKIMDMVNSLAPRDDSDEDIVDAEIEDSEEKDEQD